MRPLVALMVCTLLIVGCKKDAENTNPTDTQSTNPTVTSGGGGGGGAGTNAETEIVSTDTNTESDKPQCNEFSGYCKGPAVNLTASPLAPDDIMYVSKFHSCNGHAFPQIDSPNSAKHYFYPIYSKENTNDLVPLYAACSGTVKMMQNDRGESELPNGLGVRGRRFHLFCDDSSTGLEYFHVNFDDSLLGTHVKAGDLLGHADTRVGGVCQHGGCSNFDIAMADGSDDAQVSLFSRMDATVLALWVARGITDVSVVTRSPGPTCTTWRTPNSDSDNWFTLTP